jgi:heme-degrading monooxygenase HmoA
MKVATTPPPPYYAVIFTSEASADREGYPAMSERMQELAREQPGYLGFEAARDEIGVSVSYWKDLESIQGWHKNLEHREAQRLGRDKWYDKFTLRICLVEREYGKY